MPKKPTKPTGPQNPPNVDSIQNLAEKIDRNPLIRKALQEAMKKAKAQRKGKH